MLETSSFIFLFWYTKSTTKESIGAFAYLFCFSAFLGLPFFAELLTSLLALNLPVFYLSLSARVIIFFGKLPVFCFHYWLPKAHVEVLTSGSVILAALMLKFGVCFLSAFLVELVFCLLLRFGRVVSIMGCSDFKVFIAFSSILHMTLLGGRVRLFNEYFSLVYLSFHTVLSAQIFFQFGLHYKLSGTRLIAFFGGVFGTVLILVWLRLPPFILFVAEILQFQYFGFSLWTLVLFFALFWVSGSLSLLKLASVNIKEKFSVSNMSFYSVVILSLYFI